jgi:hypothetical protein
MLVWGTQCWWGEDWAAKQSARRRHGRALIRKLLLDKSKYIPGGWLLNPAAHPGMRCAVGGFQVADQMPNCEEVPCNGHQIVVRHTPQGTYLQLCVNGAEAPAGYSAPAGTWIGVGLTGT